MATKGDRIDSMFFAPPPPPPPTLPGDPTSANAEVLFTMSRNEVRRNHRSYWQFECVEQQESKFVVLAIKNTLFLPKDAVVFIVVIRIIMISVIQKQRYTYLGPVVSSCWPSSPGDFTSKAKLLRSTI